METDNKELKEETTKKEADKKETESKEETKQPVEETAVQKKKSKKWIGIVAAVVAVILLAYGGVAIYYQSHFLNHTYINNSDCSNMTATEVAAIMDQQSQQYSLQILGRDENGVQEEIGTITASEIGMYWVDTLNAAQELLDRQNEFLWIEMLWSTQNHDVVQGVSYDADKLQEQLAQMPALQNKNMIAPEDAYISEYSEKNKNYEIIPETMGIELNNNLVEEVVSTAIMQGDTTVDLEEQGCYETAKITAEDAALVKACDTMNKWVSAQITYDWNGNKVVVDGDTIHEWIQTDNKDPQLDEEAIEEFVAEQAKEYDTYGKKRKFTTVQGIELTLPSGAYGWKTDREEEVKELTASIEKGENIDKEHICCAMSGQQSLAKKEWLKQRFGEGLVFYRSAERGKCFIEYIPAENAWVPIDAAGWLYINCLWVSGSMKGHGYSSELLEECLRNAKAQGKNGVCILCAEGRKREFLADPKFLTHKGFKVSDISDCGIDLMYLPLAESAQPPKFKACAKHPKVEEDGFVLYYTDQCPYTYYWVPKVQEAAKEHGIPFKAIHVTEKETAQNVPAPVTTYALFRDGKFVTQSIQSDKKFLKLAGAAD